jgi:hypothetical protein
VTGVATLLGAALLAFVAYKLLMGVIRVGVIILILAVLYGMWSQGTIG